MDDQGGNPQSAMDWSGAVGFARVGCSQ